MKEYIPKHFYNKYYNPILNECLEKLEEDFQKNFYVEIELYVKNFENICNKIIQQYPNFKVGYIMYNCMLHKILNHNYSYDIYVYSKDWYFGEEIKIGEYNVNFVYKYFDEVWQKLLSNYRGYVNKIVATDINNLMIEMVKIFNNYVIAILRNSITKATEIKEYKNLNKEQLLYIQCGKFYDNCEFVYKENAEKNIIKIKKELNKSKSKKHIFEDFQNLNFDYFDFEEFDIRYSDFRDSSLKNVNFRFSSLEGAKFNNADLDYSNFSYSAINNVNFENANLTNCKFNFTIMSKGKNKFMNPFLTGFLSSNFNGADLSNSDFSNSILYYIDFTNSILQNTNFENCKLYNCRFTHSQVKDLILNDEQINDLVII